MLRPLKLFKDIMLVLAVFLAAPHHAYAYVDPGTGSMILQLLLGGFVGAFLIVKLYWRSFKDWMQRIHSKFSANSHKEQNR